MVKKMSPLLSLLHHQTSTLWQKLNRKKPLLQTSSTSTSTHPQHQNLLSTPLNRCLTTLDLTLLGIGHMLGAGIFVLTGTLVHDIAGPSSILSYLIASFSALLSALCYAEFGARVPKAGSAYTYTYVILGEFYAFLIGWNIILEHLLGAASVAKSWSASFDSLFDMAIRNSTLQNVGEMHGGPGMAKYADFVAFSILIVVIICVSSGAKLSINVNSIFTVLNIIVVTIIIIAGFSLAEIENWKDHGGFLRHGWQGVFAGAGTCFYAYIGFEGIAIAGEEAKTPAKSLPIATGLSMLIVTLMYVLCSAALTLMVPSDSVDVAAPFPAAFALRGMTWVKYIVAIGAISCISTSMLGSMFSMPRAVYAMASDGLLFDIFSKVNGRTQTPIVAIVCFGLASAFCALLMDISTLVEFLSIGTLLSFTIVATSILVIRYRRADYCPIESSSSASTYRKDIIGGNDNENFNGDNDNDNNDYNDDGEKIIKELGGDESNFENAGKLKKILHQNKGLLWNLLSHKYTITVTISTMVLFIIFLSLIITFPTTITWWRISLIIIFLLMILFCLSVLLLHEQNRNFSTFQVPFVPFLPAFSIFINVSMMLKLGLVTWLRLVIWLALGFVIYFTYGIRNSHENENKTIMINSPDKSGSEDGQEEQERNIITNKSGGDVSYGSHDTTTKTNKEKRILINTSAAAVPKLDEIVEKQQP